MEESADFARARERTLVLYYAATVLMLAGLGILTVYTLRLGAPVDPGVEQSFGLAVSLMFLMGAMTAHLLDRLYRVWPLGRRFHPTVPAMVTDRSWATVLAVSALVIAGGAIAYILAGLLS
jgi:hypothetical protein